jgi:hypothetical protein
MYVVPLIVSCSLQRGNAHQTVPRDIMLLHGSMRVQVIGSHLCEKPREQWQQYIDRKPADTGDDPTAAIHEVIHPSYIALPLSVKRCFLSFAAFPEDERIAVDQLLDMWAGWELVAGPHSYTAAQSSLQRLEDACLIHSVQMMEPWEGDGIKIYMHDVLHDLARSIARGQKSADRKWGEVEWPFLVIEVFSQPIFLM